MFKAYLIAVTASGLLVGAVSSALAGGPGAKADSRAVFERRILPILQAPNPSSCSECHLSGVDLKDYIRSSEAETYASLLKEGLVDPGRPEASKLLRLIRMSSPKSKLVTQQARDAEYAAFKAWIEAAAQNKGLSGAKAVAIGPRVSDAVIRHSRIDQAVESFTRSIWSQEGRCMGCHKEGNPSAQRFVAQYGARVAWLVPDDPEATMRRLIAQKAVNAEKPEESPLLLKPLGALDHGGGVKFARGDRTYQMFLGWLQDYSRCVHGGYRDEASLPPPPASILVPTGNVIEIVDGPEAWIGKSLRVDVFAFDTAGNRWKTEPVATADRPFRRGHGSKLLVFRLAPGSNASPQELAPSRPLEPGRYLLRFYLADIPPAGEGTAPALSPRFLGQKAITSEWKSGKDETTRVTPDFDPVR